jgi:hypothetical protein
VQKQLSNFLNLSEQLKYIKQIISYASLNIKNEHDSFCSQLIATKQIEKLTRLKQIKSKIINPELDKLLLNTKNEIQDLKSLKSPPHAIQQVAECVCLLFSKPCSYLNFIKIIDSPSIVLNMKTYDEDSLSDYTIRELAKYINSEEDCFNCEYISKMSKFCGVICQWVRFLCQYSRTKSTSNMFDHRDEKINHLSFSKHDFDLSKNYPNLRDYLVDNAFYGFSWFLYLKTAGNHFNDLEIDIDQINTHLDSLHLKNEKLLDLKHYFDRLESHQQLSKYLINAENRLAIMEAHLKARNARGSFFIIEKNPHDDQRVLITDLNLLAEVLNLIANFKMCTQRSNDSHELSYVLGDGVPVWNLNELKEILRQNLKIEEEKVK